MKNKQWYIFKILRIETNFDFTHQQPHRKRQQAQQWVFEVALWVVHDLMLSWHPGQTIRTGLGPTAWDAFSRYIQNTKFASNSKISHIFHITLRGCNKIVGGADGGTDRGG